MSSLALTTFDVIQTLRSVLICVGVFQRVVECLSMLQHCFELSESSNAFPRVSQSGRSILKRLNTFLKFLDVYSDIVV